MNLKTEADSANSFCVNCNLTSTVMRPTEKSPSPTPKVQLLMNLTGVTWLYQDLFLALQCFMFEFWDSVVEINSTQANNSPHFNALKNEPYATPPSCIEMPQGTKICFIRINRGEVCWLAIAEIMPLYLYLQIM